MSKERLAILEHCMGNYNRFVEEQNIQIEMLKEKNKELMERIEVIEDKIIDRATGKFKVITDFPIALDSPDHLAPHGTKQDNSSDELWINNIVDLFGRKRKMRIMDLGCAGGALVKDLLKHTPYVIGLEGSDYSIIHEREHWRQEDNLVNNNLFTCDISRPFNIEYDNKPFLCDVITAWEVCEHIHPDRVEGFFKNIYNHLMPGGVFMGSVSSFSDKNVSEDGKTYELHQSAMPEEDWNLAIESTELFTIKKYDKSKMGYVREGQFFLYLEKKDGFAI